jgi:hypothetical protein
MGLNKKLEEQFTKIAENTISEAEKVKCSLRAFADGLRSIAQDVKSRIEQVEDELRNKDED